MSTAFTVASADDAQFLSEMRHDVWLTTYRGIYPDELLDNFDFEFHNAKNLSMIKSPEYTVYFITENGVKAGYLILQHKNPLYIRSLYLLSGFQRKGIGTEAFEFVRSFCRKNRIKEFYLSCHPENKNALAFYEKMGGKITARDIGHENNRENSFRIEFSV